MSVARPVNQPTNPEAKQLRHAGSVSKDGYWIVAEESKRVGDGYLHSCGTYLLGEYVYLTVIDGVFPLSGSGEVRTECVPYCPSCEKKPEGHGFLTPSGIIVVN
jgi:hypothetical protein